jgi:phosphohistidine phosphatase
MSERRYLYLMRHAEAEIFTGADDQRSLTPNGFEQAQAMGRWLALQDAAIETVCHSPYLRARQTCEAVCQFLGSPPMLEFTDLVPSGNLESLLQRWEITYADRELPTRALWVTHQPLVGKLCSYLVEGSVDQACPFAPATVVLLEYQYVGPGCASIAWCQDVYDLP